MTMQSISIDLPSDILLTINDNVLELKKEIKIAFAIRLFQLQKISIGKAAQIASMSRLDFETLLSENEINIAYSTISTVNNDANKLDF